MRRIIALICAVLMVFACSACSNTDTNNDTSDTTVVDRASCIGEWKANVWTLMPDGSFGFAVRTIILNDDGTGSYRDKEMTWQYQKDAQIIEFSLISGEQDGSFDIAKEDGKTVLKFYSDIFYRADEFKEIEKAEKPTTNWDEFECEYYEDLPIGLLSTPDATSDIVIKYINEKTGRNDTYEVKQIYNAYHANLIEIENVFTIYNCKGTARFYFDWAQTLYNIEFEFSEDGGITPAIMSKVHDDIDNIVGGKCATNYLIDKGASNPHDEFTNNGMCTCGWHLQEDLNCTARMTSYFNNRPIECTFELERNKYTNKTNYNVSGNIGAGSDSITVSGVTIKGTYHDASSPYVSGTATNNSSKTVEFIKIKIALKDSSGKVTNTVWTYAVGAEGLAPGETTQWTVYCTKAEDIEITIFN